MKLAYVIASLGAPPGDGLQEHTLLLIRELVQAGVDLDVFAMARRGDIVDLAYLEQRCGVSLREPLHRTRLPGVVNALLRRAPQRLLPQGVRQLRAAIQSGGYDSYHFDGLGATVLLSRRMRPAIIGLLDPGTVRFRRFVRSAHGPRARARALVLLGLHTLAEASLARPSLVWHLVSPIDATAVRSRRRHQEVFVAPIMRPIPDDRPRDVNEGVGAHVLIWVDARQPHQARAAASFIDQVAARSPKAADLHVRVLARSQSLGRWIGSKAVSVDVVAFADDLDAELAAADVVVIPDQLGSGLKSRVLDAMAAGRPVLASETAAEGFDFVNGRDLVVYQDLREARDGFARMLDDADYRRGLGERARTAVSVTYDPSIVGAAVLQQHLSLRVG